MCAEGAQLQLEELEACTVLICDRSEQAFVDECRKCHVLIGPCGSATFVRDCRDCVFWIATGQLRTRNCVDCTFFVHAHTEPIIETSKNLAFAPFAASYPGLTEHFKKAGLKPEKNFWCAIFDFSGRADAANWRILPLAECEELEVAFPSEGLRGWECPSAALSQELLCEPPPVSSESAGHAVSNIPQTRPPPPPRPTPGTMPRRHALTDAGAALHEADPAGRASSVENVAEEAERAGAPHDSPGGRQGDHRVSDFVASFDSDSDSQGLSVASIESIEGMLR